MITDRQTYREYVKEDLKAYGLTHVGFYNYWWMDCLRFQLRLRKIEYLHNTAGHNPLKGLWRFVLEVVNHRLATRLGFTIPKNVFGPGLHIVHYGTIVVHPDARVGRNCRLHPSTSIGDYNGVPRLGDNVYIGPGAKIYGPVTLGDNVAVGANTVVNKSFGSNVTLGGVPARIVAEKGAMEQGVFGDSIINVTNNNLPTH
jgi:serine O-acetyltransferase